MKEFKFNEFKFNEFKIKEETKMEKKINYEKAFKMIKNQVIKEYGWAEEDYEHQAFSDDESKGMIIAYHSIIRLIRHIEENEDYGCLE